MSAMDDQSWCDRLIFLGKLAVRNALAIWLPDIPSLNYTIEESLDFFANGISSYWKRRDLSRLIDTSADKIARSLNEQFKGDGEAFSKTDCQAIVDLVVRAFKELRVDPAKVIEFRNNPGNYAAGIERQIQHNTTLSKKAIGFASRLANQLAELIFDFQRALPEYSRRSIELLVDRSDELLAAIERVLTTLESIRSAAADSADSRHRWFEEKYRADLSRKCDQLQLIGLESFVRPYELTVAYIELLVDSDEADEYEEEVLHSRTISVEGALNRSKHTLTAGA